MTARQADTKQYAEIGDGKLLALCCSSYNRVMGAGAVKEKCGREERLAEEEETACVGGKRYG